MKVLNTFIDARLGGPQIRALAVAKGLRDYGIETEFLVPNGEGDFQNRAREDGFTVHLGGYPPIKPFRQVTGNLLFLASSIRSIPKIRTLINHRDIKIVHTNVSVNFHSALAASRSEASLLWHFNDILMPWPVTWFSTSVANRLADEIVVASESVADHYFNRQQDDVQTLYAPVDTEEFDPDTISPSENRAKLDLTPETVVIGTVGNLNPIKGHEYLLQAIPKVADSIDSPLTVLFVGGKLESRRSYYEKLQELASDLEADIKVRFLGHRSDIPQLLALFDVFVLPSISEACPMVVLEAMAMERPVVATEVGGVPEQIEDGEQGWLVPTKQPDAMADAIIDAISRPEEAERRGRNARVKAVEKFSLQRCVEKHVKLYQNI